ncbi:hypothetical protein [Roseivivax isoporae]|uniref:Tetratricopeptide repeat-like domain-containing protein n=1 Tax=Roseivivax isoporae LMG 25204 TaxID=1449351 RepID=X7F174_9RHOB|nr:hypothetical protein [Roseivivax isoporae]ETX26652.1 hypothetical protein RISW2_20860 [Roseivivax isoporae LMG 25204]
MSNPDSFIDEVTEEVRRDRLYGYLRRYGWIAVLLVLLIVGGAAWREYRAAQEAAQAQAFGTALLQALDAETPEARIAALEAVEAPNPGGAAVRAMLAAGAGEEGAADADPARLSEVATSGASDIYRRIASFKALVAGADTMSAEERRIGFEALAEPGNPLRLLAEEQLALLDIQAGETDAALARLEAIAADAEATQGLRQRTSRLIVALGGDSGGAS